MSDEELSLEEREQRLREAWEAKQGSPDADRLAAATQEKEQLTASLRDQQITHAFLTHGDTKWHDRDTALTHLDRSQCVGDSGDVDPALVIKAAQELAACRPYLVRPVELPNDVPLGRTGVPFGSGRKYRGPNVLHDSALREKYRMDSMQRRSGASPSPSASPRPAATVGT